MNRVRIDITKVVAGKGHYVGITPEKVEAILPDEMDLACSACGETVSHGKFSVSIVKGSHPISKKACPKFIGSCKCGARDCYPVFPE